MSLKGFGSSLQQLAGAQLASQCHLDPRGQGLHALLHSDSTTGAVAGQAAIGFEAEAKDTDEEAPRSKSGALSI